MKIFLFDPESGVYQGEDFADEAIGAGGAVPSGATSVVPPPVPAGMFLRFVAREERWEVCTLAAWKQAAAPAARLASSA